MQVRARGGVALQEGIDCLLVGLYSDLDAVPELEAFVSGVTHVAVPQVAAGLQQGGRWHALALLHAAKGHVEAALQIWQVRRWIIEWYSISYRSGLICRPEAARKGSSA